ncbi:MAG: DUF441 family protein [Firmicutes bacterium]|nr:DUF441 family protein [Bacillota bacterium]
MSGGSLLLLLLVAAGLVARSYLISIAALVLLALRLFRLPQCIELVEKKGLEAGLLFLLLAIMAPFAADRVGLREIAAHLTSLPGLMAVLGGALATHLNGEGLSLKQTTPELIFGLLIGSLLGILLLGGIPVGPLMAAGLTALLLELCRWHGG